MTGSDGDFYIDTASWTIYGPKVDGVWPAGVSLVGPAGSPGPTGATGPAGATGATGATGSAGSNGLSVLNGSGAPGGGTGSDGDFYIDTSAWAIYGPKAGGVWGSGTSMIGGTGPPGPTAVSSDANNVAILGGDGLLYVGPTSSDDVSDDPSGRSIATGSDVETNIGLLDVAASTNASNVTTLLSKVVTGPAWTATRFVSNVQSLLVPGLAPATNLTLTTGTAVLWDFKNLPVRSISQVALQITTAGTSGESLTVAVYDNHTDGGPGSRLFYYTVSVTSLGRILSAASSNTMPSSGWIEVGNPSTNTASVGVARYNTSPTVSHLHNGSVSGSPFGGFSHSGATSPPPSSLTSLTSITANLSSAIAVFAVP